MTVYVDELRKWPTKIACFKAGSCHLTADTLPELHAFARRIRLRREWFQDHSVMAHYDLTAGKRELALAEGAVFKTAREQLRAKRGDRPLATKPLPEITPGRTRSTTAR